jgi:transposase
VDQLNLTPMHAEYGEERRRQPRMIPRMMTKLLVYGYCVRVYSSRKIQLAAGNDPDFRTISDFRKTHLKTLSGFLEKVLKILLEAGACSVGRNQDKGHREQTQGYEL